MDKNTFFLTSFLFFSLLFLLPSLVLDFPRTLLLDYYLPSANEFFWGGVAVILVSSLLFALSGYFLHSKLPLLSQNSSFYFAISSLLFLVLYYFSFSTTSLSIFPYIEMNGLLYTLVAMVLNALIVSSAAFLLVDVKHSLKESVASGGLSSLFALVGAGCPVCGSALFSLIGASFSIGILPFQGIELKVLSLGVALYGVTKVLDKQSAPQCCSTPSKQATKEEVPSFALYAMLALLPLTLFVQFQIFEINSLLASKGGAPAATASFSSEVDLSDVDVASLSSTSQTIVAVFPELKEAKSQEEIAAVMMPKGAPSYSAQLGGITFDDPVNSMEYLARYYFVIKEDVRNNNPEAWQRYLSLAAAPKGISCEFCCGVGPQGVDSQGNLRCGCKHNIALQGLALGLISQTDMSDAEVLREVMRWKTMFFPKSMLSIATSLAGKDPSDIPTMPSMVGGC